MSRLSDLRALPRLLSMAIATRLDRWAMQDAIDFEKHLTYGRALGLTEAEAREIIAWWVEWYHGRVDALDLQTVRESMIRRAVDRDGKWHP